MMILVIAMLFAIYRLIRGPYLWDRLMALNLISIKSLTLLIVYAVYRERYILLDVSLAYAIAGFFSCDPYIALYIKGRSCEMIYKAILMLGWFYLVFGVIGIYRFPDLYSRLLTSSKIDTVAVLTIVIGLIVKIGFRKPVIKLILILIFYITNESCYQSCYCTFGI